MHGAEVQTFLFDRAKWSVAKANKWLKRHGRAHDVDERPDTLRYRQVEPDRFVPGSFRTYPVPDVEGI